MIIVVQNTEDGGCKASSENPSIEVTAPTVRATLDGFAAAAAHVVKPTRIREIQSPSGDADNGYPAQKIGCG